MCNITILAFGKLMTKTILSSKYFKIKKLVAFWHELKVKEMQTSSKT